MNEKMLSIEINEQKKFFDKIMKIQKTILNQEIQLFSKKLKNIN